MPYIRSRWTSNTKDFIIEKKYHSQRYMPTAPAAKERRQPKRLGSSLNQEKINQRRRTERTTMLMMDNFAAGDTYITLTFSERPSPEEARKAMERFKRQLRDRMKRNSREMKYISVIENMAETSRGRPHSHMLVNKLSEEEIEFAIKSWRHGRVKIERYGGHAMDASKLADYFCKEEIDHETKSGLVMTSKNLSRREPVKHMVTRSETYRDEIKAPKGYILIEQLSYSTRTEEGYPMQVAIFERAPGRKEEKKRGGIT